jgi:homoserine O-acetyltransferase/O-succinyltransferase
LWRMDMGSRRVVRGDEDDLKPALDQRKLAGRVYYPPVVSGLTCVGETSSLSPPPPDFGRRPIPAGPGFGRFLFRRTRFMRDAGLRLERFRDLTLPSGRPLDVVDQVYRLDGQPAPDGSNVVLLFHSLTGGPEPREWWPDLIGPGGVLDPGQWALLTPNLLGSCYGTRGRVRGSGEPDDLPPVPLPDELPGAGGPVFQSPGLEGGEVDVRDMVYLTGLLLERLGIPSVRLATGGSLGGMASLEWAATFPDLTREVVVFAAPAAHTAQAIGFSRIQRALLRLGGPEEGLKLARQAAMLTYRSAREMERRFGRERREDGLFQIESYLVRQGEKLQERFHPESYRILTNAMDRHDVGEGRGGFATALKRFEGELTGVGIPGDLLYTPEDVRRWTDPVGAHYREIDSERGHDAFILEQDQVAVILEEVLER